MAWRFRKRISFGKFLIFNISKSGVSTTIGVKGASVNIGKKGVYRNLGIPGTGLYSREKISDSPHDANQQPLVQHNSEQQRQSGIDIVAVLIIIELVVLFVIGSIIRTYFNF